MSEDNKIVRKNIVLITSAAVCVAVVWYVRLQNLSFKYAPIITSIVIVSTIALYYKYNEPVKKCVVTRSADGTITGGCELDSDCNAPNGQCWKNAQGQCGCVCKNGYSGDKCQTQGIPWNSPNCMGPNTQWPARKDKNNMCVCPPGNWASDTIPGYGYVQCAKCAGDYGPLAGSAACQSQWGQQNLLSNTCITDNNSNQETWCADFLPNTTYPPPGKTGNVVALGKCGALNAPNSCRCSEHAARAVCQVNGWVVPNGKNETCYDDNVPRQCSSYNCK